MTLPLEITPCSQGMFRIGTRFILLTGGVAMSVYFICRIATEGDFQADDILFAGVLPALGILLSRLHVEIDGEHISKTVRLGSFWRWEFSSVRWNDVRRAEVYQTSQRGLINLKLTTNSDKHLFFSLPERSVGAARFHEIAKCFKRDLRAV